MPPRYEVTLVRSQERRGAELRSILPMRSDDSWDTPADATIGGKRNGRFRKATLRKPTFVQVGRPFSMTRSRLRSAPLCTGSVPSVQYLPRPLSLLPCPSLPFLSAGLRAVAIQTFLIDRWVRPLLVVRREGRIPSRRRVRPLRRHRRFREGAAKSARRLPKRVVPPNHLLRQERRGRLRAPGSRARAGA